MRSIEITIAIVKLQPIADLASGGGNGAGGAIEFGRIGTGQTVKQAAAIKGEIALRADRLCPLRSFDIAASKLAQLIATTGKVGLHRHRLAARHRLIGQEEEAIGIGRNGQPALGGSGQLTIDIAVVEIVADVGIIIERLARAGIGPGDRDIGGQCRVTYRGAITHDIARRRDIGMIAQP